MPLAQATLSWINRAGRRFDKALYALSTYAVPVIIGLLSLVAILTWKPHFPPHQPAALEFQAIEDRSASLDPAQAVSALRSQEPVSFLDTSRSEAPFWVAVKPSGQAQENGHIEFPSRHAVALQCWDLNSLAPIGNATRLESEGAITTAKAGFAIQIPDNRTDFSVLCRTSFVGPARLSVTQWQEHELQAAANEFHRNMGLLDGGLIVLALFMLVTALIVKQSRYVLFAAWLLLNLRVGALSAGWDMQWLGYAIPPEWTLRIRSISMAAYCVLTVTLFKSIFEDELPRIGHTVLLRVLQWTSIALVALSLILPYKPYLPLLWFEASFIVVSLLYLTIKILVVSRSPTAVWYGASLFITLAASLSEVLSAAFDLRALTGSINSVTAALSSSLLAALALAEQMRQEHNQRMAAQAELEHTYEAMPVGLFTLDGRGQFLSANPALIEMLGADVMREDARQWDLHFAEGSLRTLLSTLHSESACELEIEDAGPPGPNRSRFLVKAILARGKVEGSLQDITEKARALEELRFMADNDPLTKVFNRRGIEKMLDNAMAQLAEGKPLALAYLDLDRFKLINGLYGHSVGDVVLKQVCTRITAMLSGGLQIGRVGGDEFIIVMPDTPIEAASWICQGIINQVTIEPYRISDKAFKVRASIGLIEIAQGTSMKDALSSADQACRDAKAKGSSGLAVYEKNSGVFRAQEAEFKLVERLSEESAPTGLYLEMQPIMSVAAPFGSLNFEVLLRMRDFDGSIIPAGRIIAAAENSGRTSIIDRWVLATTLAWVEDNCSALGNTQFVCMNLSGASLNDERFIQDALAILEERPLAANRLCIEITESVALHDMGNTRRFINKVRSYGVKVALDDFGAGYTSFAYLKELPADVLKIDGSFIVNMNAHPANVAIVEAIVSLARSLGMKTIAEWAEDTATVQTLVDIGIDYIQGYVIARPQEASRILEAGSAADFIQDAALKSFIQSIEISPLSQAQMDLLALVEGRRS